MLGIIGITAPALEYFLRHLHEEVVRQPPDSDAPLYILRMENQKAFVDSLSERQIRWPVYMQRAIQHLLDHGATKIVCPANTNHAIYEYMSPEFADVWLHIADPVIGALNDRNISNAMLLGTAITVESGFYQQKFNAVGGVLHRPSPEAQALLHKAIIKELIIHQPAEYTAQALEMLRQECLARDCTAIVLGCTELGMMHHELASWGVEIIDSCQELARASHQFLARGAYS